MQAYGAGFARVYNQRWAGLAQKAAPALLDFYIRTPTGLHHPTLLDLGCGTGQLAMYFLEHSFRVTGLDLSSDMLEYARDRATDYIGTGHARFERGDMTRFSMADRFGLVVATGDTLNHLESLDALRHCLRSVFPLLVNDGFFIFDLNTRVGLSRWNNLNVEEADDALIVTRGLYDGRGERAWMRISGFLRSGRGLYQRFEETFFNTVYDLAAVRQALLEAGWASAYFARLTDLTVPLEEPENEARVFIVAQK